MADGETQGKAKARNRKQTKFALCWVNETAAEVDEDGKEIEPSRQCFVMMDLPPGLDEKQARNREAIKRACKRAVFDEGYEDYGNKQMVVISYDAFFEIPFEKRTVTKLCPK
jgi:hypothetical protein